MRRLNRDELGFTLGDLLRGNGSASLTAALPRDGRLHGFDTIAALLDVSDVHWQLLDEITESLLSERLAAPATDPVRQALLPCPFAEEGEACVRRIVGGLAARAWRRPVADAEVGELVAVWSQLRQAGQAPADALKGALQAVLLSPHFLYRVELDRSPGSDEPHEISQHELAARLSYALWSSLPDETLRQAADRGALGTAAAVKEQAARLLADPRADRFALGFADRWLGLEEAAERRPDPTQWKALPLDLAAKMRTETQQFVRELLRQDAPIEQLLTARFSFADLPLATHYGAAASNPGLKRNVFQKIDLAGTPRVGLLSQGAFLLQTSLPTRTSPVKRGEWVLERLLCSPPPPAPPGVEALPEVVAAGTLREQMELHRASPACAACHKLMDPIGLGLEAYDAAGLFRATENGRLIDTRGELPTGETFDGPAALAAIVARDPRFGACVARHFTLWTSGRWQAEPEDDERLETLAAASKGLRSLLLDLVSSDDMRRQESTR